MAKIEIYGKQNCKYCDMAKEFCHVHNLDYVYRDIASEAAKAEMLSRNPEARTVPQIFVGSKLIGGYADLNGFGVSKLQQMIGG